MANQFYRHSIGYTPDQVRAERQIRAGRSFAIATVALFGLYLCLQLLPSVATPPAIATATETATERWVTAVFLGTLLTVASASYVLAITRTKFSATHSFHARAARWSWFLPVVFVTGCWLGWQLGQTTLAMPLLLALVAWAAIAEVWLRRAQRLGAHMSPRVCVVDVVNRTTTWHSEAELAALDEAADSLRGEIPDQSDRSYGGPDGTS
ncbi:MAG: hypothetical protein K0U64_10875 [Actinomycetia bacterium]|nr:hypothetical protein [Actinomycetes bacterium]